MLHFHRDLLLSLPRLPPLHFKPSEDLNLLDPATAGGNASVVQWVVNQYKNSGQVLSTDSSSPLSATVSKAKVSSDDDSKRAAILLMLIAEGVVHMDHDIYGNAVTNCVQNDLMECLKVLLEADSIVTPNLAVEVCLALANNVSKPIVNTLVEHVVAPDLFHVDASSIFIRLACSRYWNMLLNTMKLISGGHGIDDVVKATDDYGNTALHHAARQLQPQVVKTLIDNGAAITAVDRFGRLPLHLVYRPNNGFSDRSIVVAESGAGVRIRLSVK